MSLDLFVQKVVLSLQIVSSKIDFGRVGHILK